MHPVVQGTPPNGLPAVLLDKAASGCPACRTGMHIMHDTLYSRYGTKPVHLLQAEDVTTGRRVNLTAVASLGCDIFMEGYPHGIQSLCNRKGIIISL